MTDACDLEPYCVGLTIDGQISDPTQLTKSLLICLAEACHDAGAPLIGHIKCHCRTAAGNFHCSLTSLRTGAQCGRPSSLAEPTTRIDVDLAVLVYGLSYETLERLTKETLVAVCRKEGVTSTVT